MDNTTDAQIHKQMKPSILQLVLIQLNLVHVVCTLVLLKATWLHSLGPKACGFLCDWQNVSPLPPSFLSPVTALLIQVTSHIPSESKNNADVLLYLWVK